MLINKVLFINVILVWFNWKCREISDYVVKYVKRELNDFFFINFLDNYELFE